MKYESTILKRLIDTYGVVGNPHYISEIIKEFIVQGKECYPNLFTYQADWLAHIDEFGLTPEYTVSYTGQRIYAPNTKEKPVKRAILKGSTKHRDIDTGEVLDAFEDGRNLELVSVRMPVLTTTGKNLLDATKHKELKDDGNGVYSTIRVPSSVYDITYSLKPNTEYILSFDKFGDSMCWVGCRINGVFSNNRGANFRKKITTDSSGLITISFGANSNNDIGHTITNIQLEQSSTYTYYEPFKSNILTVNEDVTLRGIGDVRDELDLLTGEVVERIGEIVLDGSEDENWILGTTKANTQVFELIISNAQNTNNAIICDKLPTGVGGDVEKIASGGSVGGSTVSLFIALLKTKASTVDELRTYLTSNPIVAQYTLETESIKTVDLTIHDKDQQKVEQLTSFDGGTHFTTTSQEGSLLPTLTVDVVTDLEETLNLCSTDGNTM